MKIPGMPEGVEAVRIGLPRGGDFVLLHEVGAQVILQANRDENFSLSSLIVKPEPGYAFEHDPSRGCYVVVKQFDQPLEITLSARFQVANDRQQQIIEKAIKAMADLPGYAPLIPALIVGYCHNENALVAADQANQCAVAGHKVTLQVLPESSTGEKPTGGESGTAVEAK